MFKYFSVKFSLSLIFSFLIALNAKSIVAIGVYGGYNVEDSILFNKGSLDRGIFRTTYFNMYETREESSKVGNSTIDSKFIFSTKQSFYDVLSRPIFKFSAISSCFYFLSNSK